MKTIINGIQMEGTPEEIKQFIDLNKSWNVPTVVATGAYVEFNRENKCSHCGSTSYTVSYSSTTLLGFTPKYENGVCVSKDPNVTTTHCKCSKCGKEFTITN